MSHLRPTLITNKDPRLPCPRNGTAYLMILKAIEHASGLIHGQLDHGREHCATGHYFRVNAATCLPEALIDEVAAVNDSVPHYTDRQRKLYVRRWLRWKLAEAGMPGYTRYLTKTGKPAESVK